MKNKKTICLNMIVKNESHIIERCLESVKNHIDYWVISDTGSTDGTQEIIKEFFKKEGINGELLEHEWRDFAFNRNLALEAANGKADYILFMDADDYLEFKSDFKFSGLELDSYLLSMKRYNIRYFGRKIVKSGLQWKWVGVLHETLQCQTNFTEEVYSGEYILHSTEEGSRGKSVTNKFLNDAKVLECALKDEPSNTRYQFYLARSYFDAKEYDLAIDNFNKRIAMGGWEEEVFHSYLSIGLCHEKKKSDVEYIIESYLKSYNYRRLRLEGLFHAIRVCRENSLFSTGYFLSKNINEINIPPDILFIESDVYEWRLYDEISICCIETGQLAEARDNLNKLLINQKIPIHQRARIVRNIEVCKNMESMRQGV